MGNVDSGKSTFIKKYSHFFKQKYGRTEGLTFFDSKIGSQKVTFIDCPGHSLLGYSNKVSLSLCDLVIYLADANCLNITNLEKIAQYKPVLVILNKFRERKDKTLKELCGTKEGQIEIHKEIAQVFKDTSINISPFFEGTRDNFVVFPLSLKTNFGVKEFEKYFSEFWCKNLQIENRSFFYVCQRNPLKYKSYSKDNLEDYYFFIDGKNYKSSEISKYNPVTQNYTLKPELSDLAYVGYKQKNKSSKINLINLDLDYEIPRSLVEILKKTDPLKKYILYCDNPNGEDVFFQLAKTLKLNLSAVSMTLDQFINLKEQGLKIGWSKKEYFDHNTIISDSFFIILESLEQLLKKQFDSIYDQIKKEFEKLVICKLLPQFIFNKAPYVVGAELINGTLKKNQILKLGDQQIRVLDIQLNKKSINSWSDKSVNCAIKFEHEQWDEKKLIASEPLNVEIPEYLEEVAEIQELKKSYINLLNSN